MPLDEIHHEAGAALQHLSAMVVSVRQASRAQKNLQASLDVVKVYQRGLDVVSKGLQISFATQDNRHIPQVVALFKGLRTKHTAEEVRAFVGDCEHWLAEALTEELMSAFVKAVMR